MDSRNRYIVECKGGWKRNGHNQAKRRNRYIVECKVDFMAELKIAYDVEIDTLWNVKSTCWNFRNVCISVEIDTLWNVKGFLSLSWTGLISVEIDTLWNVKN